MSIIDISKSTSKKQIEYRFNLRYDYGSISIQTGVQSKNKYFIDYPISSSNILYLSFKKTPNGSVIKAKYRVSNIYFSRKIHGGNHDVEMTIKHILIDGDDYNAFPDGKKPNKYIYQIILFKNNTRKPELCDIQNIKSKIMKINGNKILDIHYKNNRLPNVYFLKTNQSFSDNLISSTENATNDYFSMFIVWTVPINDYKIKNYTTLSSCTDDTSKLNAIMDWGKNISADFTFSSNDGADISKLVTNSIFTKNIIQITDIYHFEKDNFKYSKESKTDDIYIDCSPINESVEHVNFYLEKLNGKDDSTKKKVMEMLINSLVIIIVTGSVFNAAPSLCELVLNIHTSITKETDVSPILFGIEFGIGFELILITIILLIVGISKKNKDITFVAFFFLLSSVSFVISVLSSNNDGILGKYIGKPPNYKLNSNMVMYSIFPVPIALPIVKLLNYGASTIGTVTPPSTRTNFLGQGPSVISAIPGTVLSSVLGR